MNTDIDVIEQFVIFSFRSLEDLNFFTCLQQGEISDTTQSTSQVESIANNDNRDIAATTQHATKAMQKPSSSEMCENQNKRNRKPERKLEKKNQSYHSSSSSGVSANSVSHLGETKTLVNKNRKLKKGGKRKLQAFLSNKRDTNSRSVLNAVKDLHDITKRKRREKEFRKKQNRPNSLVGTCMQSLTDVRSSSSKALPIKRWCVTCPEDQLLSKRRKNSNIRLRFQAENENKTKLINNSTSKANNNSHRQSPRPSLNNAESASTPISEVQGPSKRDKCHGKNQDKNCKVNIIYNDLTTSSSEAVDKANNNKQSLIAPSSSNSKTDIDNDDIRTGSVFHTNTLARKEDTKISSKKKLKFHASQVQSIKPLYSRPANAYASDTDTSDLSKKVTHNKKERERRSQQKSLFFSLQQSHPDLIRLDKCPKIKILSDAVGLIHSLCNEERELVNIKTTLRDKNAKLRSKLENLRRKLNLA